MLNPAQHDALEIFLNTKWKDKACQLCKANAWGIHGIISMSTSDSVGPAFAGPVLPMAAMLCKNCGNTVLVNLVVAGVWPAETPPREPVTVRDEYP